MKKTALLILAAGIGSRYGAGIKQLAKVGPSGELIIDYSIKYAAEAGFDEVIFIIRKDIEAEFKEVIGLRTEKPLPVKYVYQSLSALPPGFFVPEGRTKPWGTAHAILSAEEVIDSPFLVINADDYYGRKGFEAVHKYLVENDAVRGECLNLCMAGFVLGNTLSENGTVTRGVCRTDERAFLTEVSETYEIARTKDGIYGFGAEKNRIKLEESSIVSMNMWGMPKEILTFMKDGFTDFLSGIKEGDLKAEYLLPSKVDELIKQKKASVKVLPTPDKWYGITYENDTEYVIKALADKE